jgi:hypothetical protein
MGLHDSPEKTWLFRMWLLFVFDLDVVIGDVQVVDHVNQVCNLEQIMKDFWIPSKTKQVNLSWLMFSAIFGILCKFEIWVKDWGGDPKLILG